MDDLPIIAGAALTVTLFVGPAGSRPAAAWLWSLIPLIIVGLGLQKMLPLLGATQYNLAELLRTDTTFPGIWLALLCLWPPLTAGLSARAWCGGRRLRAVCWAPASCLVAWGLLRRAVSVESINDVLGTPIWSWPTDLEYIARLSVIYLAFLWLPILVTLLSQGSRRRVLAAPAYAVLLLALAPGIVNGYSPSDNVSELFRTGGHVWFAALCLLTPWTAVLCDRVRKASGLPATVLALALISTGAYFLLDRAIYLSDIHGLLTSPATLALMFAFAVTACLMPAVAGMKRQPTFGAAANTPSSIDPAAI